MKKQAVATLKRMQATEVFSKDGLKHLPVVSLFAFVTAGLSVLLMVVLLNNREYLSRLFNNSQTNVSTPTGVSPISGISGPKAPPAAPPPAQPTRQEQLQKLIDDFQAGQSATLYVYVKDLKTGDIAKLRAGTSVPSGSIYKLFLANQVYRLAEAGKLNIYAPVPGTGYTYASCTMQMVQNSLNLCGEAVRSALGPVEQTKSLKKQGYKGTNLMHKGAAHTSPADIALLYQRLYDGGYFSKAHTGEFLGFLRNQMWRFRIPTGVPIEPLAGGKTVVLNKTGDVYDYANDGAIFYGENTDAIVVIMSNGWSKVFPDSSYAIRELAGKIYNFLNDTDYPLPYTSF